MSSPANPDQTPEQEPDRRQDQRQDRPPSQPQGKTPPSNQAPGTPAPDDPTRTWWNEPLPPIPPARSSRGPAQPSPASSEDPTLTQWSAPPPGQGQNRPAGQQPGQQPGQRPPPQYGAQYGQPPAQPGGGRPPQQHGNQYGSPYGAQPYGQQYAPQSAPQYDQPYGQQPVPQGVQPPVTEQDVAPLQQPPAQGQAQKTGKRKARSLFWPGFALGFLLLASLSCGVSAAALGLNRISLDDLRGGTGPAWTPQPITPTPVVAEAGAQEEAGAGGGSSSTRFAAGQTVRNVTNSRVNIRMSPGYLGKTASDVIGQVGPSESLQVLGDPTAADELIWWHVQTTGGQPVVGWVAEQTASGVQILGEN
ncbi:MAG: hypothetical protein U0X20_30225 [Caldilineaceae bacterium]